MLSGIGQKEQLQKFEIPVIHHSPGVGENMQDHVAMGGGTYLIESPPDLEYCFVVPNKVNEDSVYEFIREKDGPLYSLPEAEVMAFINTVYANYTDDYPDIQMFLSSVSDSTDGGMFGKKDNALTNDYYAAVYENILYKESYSIVPLLLRPKSRGSVKLKSKDPKDLPLIYPNYFDHPDDINVLVSIT